MKMSLDIPVNYYQSDIFIIHVARQFSSACEVSGSKEDKCQFTSAIWSMERLRKLSKNYCLRDRATNCINVYWYIINVVDNEDNITKTQRLEIFNRWVLFE